MYQCNASYIFHHTKRKRSVSLKYKKSLTSARRFLLVAGTGLSRYTIGPDVVRGVDQSKFARTEKVRARTSMRLQKQKRAFDLLAFDVLTICFGHLVAGTGLEPMTFGL